MSSRRPPLHRPSPSAAPKPPKPTTSPTKKDEKQTKTKKKPVAVDETVVISPDDLPPDWKRAFGASSEKRCAVVFERHQKKKRSKKFPTCFIVLPYELKKVVPGPTTVSSSSSVNSALSSKAEFDMVVPSMRHIEVATEVGKCLLDMNRATAKLAFWLRMKKCVGSKGGDGKNSFELQLDEWLKRTLTESAESVSREIVRGIALEEGYLGVCKGMLENDENRNNSSYITDPCSAAQEEIQESKDDLMACYASTDTHYFYLVDELQCTPAPSPIRVRSKVVVRDELFIPFMNMSAMTAIAAGGLQGLARLLGIPPSHGIPQCWKDTAAVVGLVHSPDKPRSVTAFAYLQRMIRRRKDSQTEEYEEEGDSPLSSSAESVGGEPSLAPASIGCSSKGTKKSRKKKGSKANDDSKPVRNEMVSLKKFYRKYDALGRYSNLRRVSDGDGGIIWTTEKSVKKIKQHQSKGVGVGSFVPKLSAHLMDLPVKGAVGGAIGETLHKFKKQLSDSALVVPVGPERKYHQRLDDNDSQPSVPRERVRVKKQPPERRPVQEKARRNGNVRCGSKNGRDGSVNGRDGSVNGRGGTMNGRVGSGSGRDGSVKGSLYGRGESVNGSVNGRGGSVTCNSSIASSSCGGSKPPRRGAIRPPNSLESLPSTRLQPACPRSGASTKSTVSSGTGSLKLTCSRADLLKKSSSCNSAAFARILASRALPVSTKSALNAATPKNIDPPLPKQPRPRTAPQMQEDPFIGRTLNIPHQVHVSYSSRGA